MSYAYYRFFPGDYQRDTMHLGWFEDLAYRRLIDLYNVTGKPIRNDRAYILRAVRAAEPEQQTAVDTVLAEFFVLKPDGWHQLRCDAEVRHRSGIDAHAQRAANARWERQRKKPEESITLDAHAMRSQSTRITNQNQNQTPEQKLSISTWNAYSSAYLIRWKCDPKRNATVNSQIKAFVSRLGADAPAVAEFYLSHNDRFYVQKRHQTGPMLQNAESLYQQWKTGTKSTALEARSAEQKDAVVEQINRVKANMKGDPWTSSQPLALPTPPSGKK